MTRIGIFVAALTIVAFGFAVGAEQIPNSMYNAKVGEWALYNVPGGYQQKQTVAKVEGSGTDAQVTVRIDNIYNNQVVQTQEMVVPAGPQYHGGSPEDGASISIGTENVTVKGRSLPATVVTVTSEGDVSKTYLSMDVPLFGLIRIVNSGDGQEETAFDLVDYGDN